MPQFKVTDPSTGQSLVLTGDSPPSEQELTDIFAQHGSGSQASTSVLAAHPVPHKGYAAQVREMGATGPDKVAAKPFSELGQNWKDVAVGTAEGVPAGIVGTPGNVESLARAGLSKVSDVSPQSVFPTSQQVGDSFFGKAPNDYVAGGRIAGELISPNPVIKGAQIASKVAGPIVAHTLGATTGAGGAAVKEAFSAGREGGSASQAFLDNMRGNAPVGDVVRSAKDAVEQMRQDRGAAYQAGIGSTIQGDPAILDFKPIDNAIRNVSGVGMFKGKSLSSGADKVWNKIEDVVDDWRQSDPATFHTPEGLDALKKKIGNLAYEEDLKAVAGPNTPGSVIIDNVYNAIKKQIVQQAPGYADVMKDYMTASDELREVEKSLSLGRNATTDTGLRKLQSLLRNNANTNYGQRVAMGNALVDNGASDLMPSLAGQMMSARAPRGIASVGDISALGGAALAGHPGALALAPLTSPRVVGEGAHAMGRLLSNPNKVAVAGGNANVAGVPAIANSPALRALTAQQLMAQLLMQPQSQAQ